MMRKRKFEYYCKEDISNIENYNEAKLDDFKGWHIHHRLETHNSDGERRLVDITLKELKALDMYYNRPANELIFLKSSEHQQLHKKGKPSWNKGKKCGPHSEEWKRHVSEVMKGGNSTSWGKGHIPWNKGIKIDTKEHTSWGKHKTYHKAWNRKKVKCIETGEIFDSVAEAAIAKGLKGHSGITNVANGKAATAGNLHWEYI